MPYINKYAKTTLRVIDDERCRFHYDCCDCGWMLGNVMNNKKDLTITEVNTHKCNCLAKSTDDFLFQCLECRCFIIKVKEGIIVDLRPCNCRHPHYDPKEYTSLDYEPKKRKSKYNNIPEIIK